MTNEIVCTLTPGTIRTRKAGLLPGLVARADACEDTPDGYRLRFRASGEVLQAIAATVDAERQCCRFLRFQIGVEPDGGEMVLTVSGPQGTREFLAALIDPS